MVDCAQFFEEYSAFRDDRLEAGRREEIATHLRHCPACARYHHVVEGGVEVVRSIPPLEPSSDFMARLEGRIRAEEANGVLFGRSGSGAPMVMTVAIAATLAAIAWMPIARPRAAVHSLPPVVAHAPYRVEAVSDLFRPGPLLLRDVGDARRAEPPASLLFQYTPLGARTRIVPAVHAH